MSSSTVTRTSTDIEQEIDDLTRQIPGRRDRLRELQADVAASRAEIRTADAAAVRAGRGPTDPAADQHAADLGHLERAAAAAEQALLEDQDRLATLQREHGVARGHEHVERERALLVDSYAVREQLLRACWDLLTARNAEYVLDMGLHQTRIELDRIAEKTGEAEFYRGVVAFNGAVREELRGVMYAMEKLCKELGASIDSSGRITYPGRAVTDTTGPEKTVIEADRVEEARR